MNLNTLQTDPNSMVRSFLNQPLSAKVNRIAIIDIGSNTVHLVVYEGIMRTPLPLFNEKLYCGLGRALKTNGSLMVKSMNQVLHALKRFRIVCSRLDVNKINVLATAAVRNANNAAEFVERARDAIGADIQVLTAQHEAELALNAIHMGFANPDGICGDLGGGSLELIDVARTPQKMVTLPLGDLKLIDRSGGNLANAHLAIEEDLSHNKWLKQGRGRSFYAVGGTWRALARLHMSNTNAPLNIVQGYRVKPADMIAFCDSIIEGNSQLNNLIAKTVTRARQETLPYGALTMRELVKKMQPSNISFSAYGIREGLIYSFLPTVQQSKDPLLAFCEDLVCLRALSYEYALELCRWIDQFFESVDIEETKGERRLRHAVCMLSNIEWHVQRNYLSQSSFFGLAYTIAAGLSHSDRLFIAAAVYHCHGNKEPRNGNDPSKELRKLISKTALIRARRIAAAVRTAHILSIGMPGVLCDVSIFCVADTLVLRIPRAHTHLLGERLKRRLATLADRVKLKSSKIEVDN